MSFYSDASLIMYPSGYKANKIYSLKPTDGSGDFDFTRASTATRVNESGLIESVASGVPRIDYTGGGCGKLLLEGQRSNVSLQSEDFSNSAWTSLSIGETVIVNSVISPDGTLNADTLEGDGSSTDVYIRQDITLNTSTDYTFSIFAKKGTNDFLAISAEGYAGATNTLVIFDLNNGVVTLGAANIEHFADGWFRCSYTIPISADGVGRFLIYASYDGITRGFPTSSDANGQNIYIWGAQLEEGSYPTSYIPTAGATATRVAETANGAGDVNTFNDSEGVLMAEISALADDGTVRSIAISGSVTNDVVRIYYDGVSNGLTAFVFDGAYQTIFTTVLNNITENNKIAFSYKLNQFKLFINGLQIGSTDLSGNAPNGLNTLSFDNGYGLEDFYGNVKQVQYFPSALTDVQLKELTTI